MPKRTDISSILIIGAGPIVIGQACEFDYSGAQACKALKAEGYRVILVNSNPATIMTDPGLADATYIEPITPEIVETHHRPREARTRCCPPWAARPRSTPRCSSPATGALATPQRRTDRRPRRGHRPRRGPAEIPRRHGRDRHRIARKRHRPLAGGSPRGARRRRPARRHPPQLHPRRHRRRHRLQPRGIRADRRRRPRSLAHHRSADRRIRARLEGIRNGGGPRPRGQLHHRLLDRERRSDGHPHRRLRHRRARADADRQGISADARRLDRLPARDRRRYRRLERAVRGQPRRRPHGHHRDEPARVALLGAWRRRRPASRSPRSPRSSPSATRSTSWPTTSPASRRPASSRPSTTSW